MEKELADYLKKNKNDPLVRVFAVFLVKEGIMSAREIAREMGVSLKTVYNWINKYEEGGIEGLEDGRIVDMEEGYKFDKF